MTNRRMTELWIRTFINAHKLSSYQDKMQAMRSEPNPYYLMEWLVVEQMDGDNSFWSQWEGERTAGIEGSGLVGIETFFRDQLLWDMLLGSPPDEDSSAKLATALSDLEEYYGADRWQDGAAQLHRRLEDAVSRYQHFMTQLQVEEEKLEEEWKETQQQLKEEAEQFEPGAFDLEAELRKAKANWNRRRQELPRRLLKKQDPDDALLRYLVLSGLEHPEKRVQLRLSELKQPNHSVLLWMEALKQQDFSKLEAFSQSWKRFGWFGSYISQNNLARGAIPTEDRQLQALRWVTQLAQGVREEWIRAAFLGSGWEEKLALTEFCVEQDTLHHFVWYALPHEELRQRLRDVILLNWNKFTERFAKEEETEFTRLSWVLLLDPENIQQRLLRPGGHGLEADQFIEKLCWLYSEAIRRGLDVQIIVSLFAYLAKHDKETFYSFVHGMKSLSDALPILRLSSSTLSFLFGGGVRQTSARRHLLQLYYNDMDESREVTAALPQDALQKLSDILTFDKREAVLGWLQRRERDWRNWMGSAQMRAFTRLLRFRWIGTAADEAEQHKMVKEWLERHSDWVVFETDVPFVETEGVKYKIMKPGAIDAETGELLIRAVVRAEWSDSQEIHQLLDDLRLL